MGENIFIIWILERIFNQNLFKKFLRLAVNRRHTHQGGKKMRFTYKLILKMWLNVRNPQDENLGLALGKAVTKEREGKGPGARRNNSYAEQDAL